MVVLVELTEGHAQAVVREDQEDFVQQVRQVLQIQLCGVRQRETGRGQDLQLEQLKIQRVKKGRIAQNMKYVLLLLAAERHCSLWT